MLEKRTNTQIVIIFWILAFTAIPIWIHLDAAGWDTAVYMAAVRSLRAGHDPYSDAMAIQTLFHDQPSHGLNEALPYSYVYSPITLPLVRAFGALPFWLGAGIYLLLYAGGVLAQVWFGMQAVRPAEQTLFRYLAPLAAFFPGFLANGLLLSGNVAYIIYGAALLASIYAWRRGHWRWFYLVVILGSCFKAPVLSLLTIPVLSARNQWRSAFISLAAGLALFAVQPLIWPTLFHHYLQAVELQFSYNRDFGSSPAGIFSGILSDRGIPYSPACLLFYAAYAIPLFGWLLFLARRFKAGCFSLQQWMPVLLVGVILLNPRLIEYDLAPLALPIALISWRLFSVLSRPLVATVSLAIFFLALNALSFHSWDFWKLVECPLLVASFLAGSWTLLKQCAGHSSTLPLRQPAPSTMQN